ncbi:hypothetical protein MKX01_010035 [Papaver californicum]|nr:hypothetical protein MKX01_010035 [Papaver californicum]
MVIIIQNYSGIPGELLRELYISLEMLRNQVGGHAHSCSRGTCADSVSRNLVLEEHITLLRSLALVWRSLESHWIFVNLSLYNQIPSKYLHFLAEPRSSRL